MTEPKSEAVKEPKTKPAPMLEDVHRPPINPETRKVPGGGAVQATIEQVDTKSGEIPTSAPVWEGGDPGTAAPADPAPVSPDRTYWPDVVDAQDEGDPRQKDQQPSPKK